MSLRMLFVVKMFIAPEDISLDRESIETFFMKD